MTMFRKVLTACAVIALVSLPAHLAAQEKAAPSVVGVSLPGWLSSLWGDFAAWLAGAVAPAPPQPEWLFQGATDNGCLIDPHGGCGG